MHRERQIESRGAFTGGSMTSAPKSPWFTPCDASWCVWYQNVPTCSGPEAVDVAAAGLDRVLRDAGDAVLRVRDVKAVPVDRHAVVDVLVDERDLDEVALPDAELGAGGAAVERPAVDVWPDASRIGAFSAVSVTR